MREIVTGMILLLMLAGCSSRYRLFQEDRITRTDSYSEARDDRGLFEMLFPKKTTPSRQAACTAQTEAFPLNFQYASKILPGDKLRIDIYNRSRRISLSDIEALISPASSPSAAPQASPTSKTEMMVDNDGSLVLPILNEVHLEGLTEKEASELLTQSYRAYLTDPLIKVHIQNKRIYVLGEVEKKGMLPIQKNAISLYEVIARSGGMTDGAKRNAIEIISGPLGNQKARIVDMTRLSSLNSSNLMVPANSIVYVQPRFMRTFNIGVGDFSSVLSLITNTLSSYLAIDYVVNGRR